jgi:hypothetical protein
MQSMHSLFKIVETFLYNRVFKVKSKYLKSWFAKEALFTNQKMNGNIHFYNQERELCATIARYFFWLCYAHGK